MKNIAIGFVSSLILLSLMGATQIYNKYDDERNIFFEFQNVYQTLQPKAFRTLDTVPTLSDIDESEVIILSTGSVHLVTRVNDQIYQILMNQL